MSPNYYFWLGFEGETVRREWTYSKSQLQEDREFVRKGVEADLKAAKERCEHSYRTLWSDYYSWGAECTKCGDSQAGDY